MMLSPEPIGSENMNKVRVLVVDDSPLMRKLLSELLSIDPEIEVVGEAQDAYVARDKIKQLKPDVITLDVEMPKMNGLTFLKNLMRLHPMPVVMVSSLTKKGASTAIQAMGIGAVDFMAKPKVDLTYSLEDCAAEIQLKIKTAARVPRHVLSDIARRVDKPVSKVNVKAVTNSNSVPVTAARSHKAARRLIAIGASTGGTEAIKEVLTRLPDGCPGVVVTQHIPPVFSQSFAERMNQCCGLSVSEAEDGQRISDGHVYIAPGDRHLEVLKDSSGYRCRVRDGDRVNRHKPSVDVLFDSVAKHAGNKAVGVILTGMGRDGADGMKRLHGAGAKTVAQDESTSVVWGMPRAAIESGAADVVLPLESIARKVIDYIGAE